MGYVQDIHHFAVCDLCGKRQEIRESEIQSDNSGLFIPPCGWMRKVIGGKVICMCFDCQRKVNGFPVPLEFDREPSLLQRNGWEYSDEAGRTLS